MVSQLLKAVRSGFLMAGLMTCGCTTRALQDGGSGHDTGSMVDTGSVVDTGSPHDATVIDTGSTADAMSSPPLLPRDRELTCPGPHYGDAGGGYSGSCCEHVVCRAQPPGGDCPVGNDGRSYGSGSCLCGTLPSIEGPFTIAADDPRFTAERQGGPCCYITKSVSCEGRPLVVAEGIRVAPVVARADWC